MIPVIASHRRRPRRRLDPRLPPRQRPRLDARASPPAPPGSRGSPRRRSARSASLWIVVAVFGALSIVKPLRRAIVTGPIFGIYKKILPQVSQTEQEALDAGSIWWDADLFTGKPDWKKMLAYPRAQAHRRGAGVRRRAGRGALRDARRVGHHPQPHGPAARGVEVHPREGLPRRSSSRSRYGGLGFSAFAHSEIVTKISTRSGTAAVTVMVPNSLGPAELLIHYGTDEQKNHYLPRLAKGLEIPCFALTNPEAGSDAGAIPDIGIVCKGMHEGKEVLGIRLTWEKRYITLAPGRHDPRPRVQALRSRQAARRRGGPRHHAGARAHRRTRA